MALSHSPVNEKLILLCLKSMLTYIQVKKRGFPSRDGLQIEQALQRSKVVSDTRYATYPFELTRCRILLKHEAAFRLLYRIIEDSYRVKYEDKATTTDVWSHEGLMRGSSLIDRYLQHPLPLPEQIYQTFKKLRTSMQASGPVINYDRAINP